MENYLSEIFFETLEDMTVVSAVMVSQNPEDEVIDFLTKWVKENGLTTTGRAFGFDVPVTMAQQEAGMRGYEYWISIDQCIKDTDQVKCKKIAGTKYAVLTIEDPFQNPFERIPKGWGRMVEWIKENQLDQVAYSGNRYCMEEVTEVNGKQFMAIYSAVE